MKRHILTILVFCSFCVLSYSQTVTFSTTSSAIYNPERGFFVFGPMDDGTNFDYIRSQGYSLCYSAISLEGYQSSNIPQSRLNEISSAFTRIRDAGIKAVIRIVYDEQGDGIDANITWMETHLQQLQPILLANCDVIAWFQAGLIGAWGEWHSSSNNHHLNPAPVWELIKTYYPPESFVAIRTPDFVNALEGLDTNPLTNQDAFTGTPRARISHHNDCWLASNTDYGTYPTDPAQREIQKSQIENHSKFTPWGGETCAVSEYSHCGISVPEAQRFHATYLNAQYHPDVLDTFDTEGCLDNDFAKYLGYRFELISAVLPDRITKGKQFEITLDLKNAGWAPVYNYRPIYLRIISDSTSIADIELAGTNCDPRRWRPERGTITLTDIVRAPEQIDTSMVSLALWLPDDDLQNRSNPDYSIRFANNNVWDATEGHNIILNSIDVEPFNAADIDGDDDVDLYDLSLFMQRWLDICFSPVWCDDCDTDETGKVDMTDFADFSANWQKNY